MQSLVSKGQLRRFAPARDADAVIKLVEDAFNLKKDPEGQAMLRQMRSENSHPLHNPTMHLITGGSDGFVWEVDERIIGNITLIPFQSGLRPIILIANVAVDKQWQGRGIGTELTRHALRIARQRPFSEIWLQVRSDNTRAINIYRTIGFRLFNSITQWRKPAGEPIPEHNIHKYDGALFRRRLIDWPLQEAWLAAAYPKQTRWYANFDFDLLKPLSWINPLNWVDLMNLDTQCLRGAHKLLAAVTHQQTPRRGDRLWLAVDKPKPEDGRVTTLLQAFMEERWNGLELLLEYPVSWAADAIAQAGFIARRDLDWMRFEAK